MFVYFLQSICPSLKEKLSVKATQNEDVIKGKYKKGSVSCPFIFLSSLFCCVFSLTELTRFGNEMMLCKANDQDLIKVWDVDLYSVLYILRKKQI